MLLSNRRKWLSEKQIKLSYYCKNKLNYLNSGYLKRNYFFAREDSSTQMMLLVWLDINNIILMVSTEVSWFWHTRLTMRKRNVSQVQENL